MGAFMRPGDRVVKTLKTAWLTASAVVVVMASCSSDRYLEAALLIDSSSLWASLKLVMMTS